MSEAASVSIVDGENGTQVVRETMSDGAVGITVIDSGKLAASLKAPGAEFEVGIGGANSGAKVKADAGAGFAGAYGQVYEFSGDDAQENAGRFMEYLAWTKSANQAADGSGLSGGLGAFLGAGAEHVTGLIYSKASGYSPPEPKTYLVEGGVVVYGDAVVGGALAEASGSGETTQVIGAELNTDGTKTIFVKGAVSVALGAEAGPETVKIEGTELESTRLIGSDVSLKGQVELVGEVTLDADGQMVGLAVSGAGTVETSANLIQVFGTDLIDIIPEIGGGFTARVQVDVDDTNRSSVMNAMADIGLAPARVVVDPVGGTMQGVDAMAYLKTQAQRTGGVTVEQFDTSTTDVLNVALGGKFPVVGGGRVPRVQVPATVIGEDTSNLGIQAGATGGTHPSYHLRVAYPGPSGERLTTRLFVHDRPTVFRLRPFDGTVWVSVENPADVTLTRAGRPEGSTSWGVMAFFAFALGIIAGMTGLGRVLLWWLTAEAGA